MTVLLVNIKLIRYAIVADKLSKMSVVQRMRSVLLLAIRLCPAVTSVRLSVMLVIVLKIIPNLVVEENVVERESSVNTFVFHYVMD